MTFTTKIWIVFLIGWSKFPTRHDQSEALATIHYDTRETDKVILVSIYAYSFSLAFIPGLISAGLFAALREAV